MTTKKGTFGGGKRGAGKRGKSAAQSGAFTARGLTTKVKTAKGRKRSSTKWLNRQLNDPYVVEAQKRGLRSRASFKLIEMNDRFDLLKPGMRVVDLGAAPGGWTLVAVDRVKADKAGGGQVVGIDLQEMEPVSNATILLGDFLDEDAPDRIIAELEGPADIVLSDMAAFSTGHKATDHLRIIGLCEAALEFAEDILKPGGSFVAKVLKGGTEHQLLAQIKQSFTQVRHAKPPASRADSAEEYVIATGFRGRKQQAEEH